MFMLCFPREEDLSVWLILIIYSKLQDNLYFKDRIEIMHQL